MGAQINLFLLHEIKGVFFLFVCEGKCAMCTHLFKVLYFNVKLLFYKNIHPNNLISPNTHSLKVHCQMSSVAKQIVIGAFGSGLTQICADTEDG